jgi:hypothetical protein
MSIDVPPSSVRPTSPVRSLFYPTSSKQFFTISQSTSNLREGLGSLSLPAMHMTYSTAQRSMRPACCLTTFATSTHEVRLSWPALSVYDDRICGRPFFYIWRKLPLFIFGELAKLAIAVPCYTPPADDDRSLTTYPESL